MIKCGLTIERTAGARELAELAKNRHAFEDIAVCITLLSQPADVVLDVAPGGVGSNAINSGRLG